MNRLHSAAILILLVPILVSCGHSSAGFKISAPHPRLFIGDDEFSALRKEVLESDSTALRVMHDALAAKADACAADTSLPVYVKDASGRRILQVSRRVLNDVFACSYMYRFSGERKYLDRAVGILEAVCRFPDWNPTHYLDVAEMATAVAVGYDWLYDGLPDDTRKMVLSSLERFVLDTAEDSTYVHSYIDRDNNWNQVCNGGILCAAISVFESFPERAEALIRRSLESEQKVVQPFYAPDGIYPEGVGYWDYGTEFQIVSNMALEGVYGSDFGLGDLPGFAGSVKFIEMSSGTSGLSYNFSDSHASKFRLPVPLWYFAYRHHDGTILLRGNGFDGRDAADRLFPLFVVSAFRADDVAAPEKEATFFHGQGIQPMLMARTGSSPKDLYLAVKGGSAGVNHAHMDAGSFVFDAGGLRWSADPGIPPYAQSENAMKSVGKSLWEKSQDSWRWKLLPYNNISHSTLTVNGLDHRVDSTATLVEVFDTPSRMGGRFDLTPVFGGEVRLSERSAAIVDRNHLEITDRIVATDSADVEVRWTLATYAVPTIVPDGILLRQGDAEMKMQTSGADACWHIWSSSPKDYGSLMTFFPEKIDCALCGFEFTVPKGGEVTVTTTLRNASPALR